MKSIVISILFLLVPKLVVSQVITTNDDAVYLDSLFNIGSEKNHKYIRVIKNYINPNQKSYEFHDYYKSGKIAMSGITSTRDQITKNGLFIYYYENGNRKTVCNFNNNYTVGKQYNFYENGTKKEEGEHILNKNDKTTYYVVQQYWDSIGKQKVFDGNGELENKDEKTFSTGKVKNGFRDGVWTGYDKQIGYTYTETYENTKLVSGISIDSDGISHSYFGAEVRPGYGKGNNAFYNYVAKNFRTPNLPNGFTGKVVVKFVVDKDGSIIEPEILESLGHAIDEEAIRVITQSKKWTPGVVRGIKVRCTYSLPIAINY